LLFAVQVHPHDIRDEGATTVARRIAHTMGCTVVGAEASTLEERHPYPRGVLPHNPRRSVVVTSARQETPLEIDETLAFRPVLSTEAASGHDYIRQLAAAATDEGLTVIPWIKALNTELEGDWQGACVVTAGGSVVPNWLCPTRPDTERYIRSYIRSMIRNYHPQYLLIDRLRYPDWSGREVDPSSLMTCFCPTCERKMRDDGIDVEEVKSALGRLGAALANGEPDRACAVARDDAIRAWLGFRARQIAGLAAVIRDEVGKASSIWLNLWPPVFSEWLGQDYSSLGPLCDGAKFFPYHKLGGGADLAGLVRRLAALGGADPADVFTAVTRLLGLDYDIGLAEFESHGLPVRFVEDQTAAAARHFGSTPVYTGIQIWDIPVSDIRPAVDAALSGGASGLFFYCYGWASVEALEEVGRITESLRR
jgi:hypothetical protein